MSFKQQLIEMDVCKEAIDWVEDRTIQQAWKDCQRGDWMLWLLEQIEGEKGWLDEKEIMLLGCWCARRALKYIQEREIRPLKAIEAKEAWAKGEITREEMDAACAAAWDASWAAAKNAAWAAACTATHAAAAWGAACTATCAAAWNVEWAAARATARAAARAAGCDAMYNKESSIQADYIRTQFTPPKGDLCLSNNN